MRKVFGYVTSRSFNGLTIPVPAQNSCLREYADSQNCLYVLPPLEHYFKNCYMQLNTVINNIEEGDIIAMYSAGMLPESIGKSKKLINKIQSRKGALYVILESKIIYKWSDINQLLFSYSVRVMLDSMEQPEVGYIRELLR